MDPLEQAKKQTRPPTKRKGRIRGTVKVDVKKEDYLDTIEIPRVVSWRKIRLWIRNRQTKHGDWIEVRILTVNKQVQRNIAKVYMLDDKYGKKQIREVMEKGFKCCLCEKNWKLNKQWELESIEEATEYDGFNILCGKCWSKSAP